MFLRRVAGLSLCALVFITPWMVGNPNARQEWIFVTIVVVSLVPWLLHLLPLARPVNEKPRISFPLLGALAVITLLGVAATVNSRNGNLAPPLWLPSAMDRSESARTVTLLCSFLGVALAVADLARCPRWRARLLATIAVSGCLFAAYGIGERARWLPHLVTRPDYQASVFSSLPYHGTAGAYLNLALAAAAALTARAAIQKRLPLCVGWGLLSIVLTIGAFATISKAGQFFSLATLLSVTTLAFLTIRRSDQLPVVQRSPRHLSAMGRLIPCLLLTGVVLMNGCDHAREVKGRWSTLSDGVSSTGSRAQLWKLTADIANDYPAFGAGPGSFKLLVPTYAPKHKELYSRFIVTEHRRGGPVSIWNYACNDYLQYLAEWGIAGAAAFAVVLGGAIAGAIKLACRRTTSAERLMNLAPCVALLTVSAHALVDSPFSVPAVLLPTVVFIGMGWAAIGNNSLRHADQPMKA